MMNAFEKRTDKGIQLLEVFKDRRSRRSNDDFGYSKKKKGNAKNYEFGKERKKRNEYKGESQKEFKRNKDSFRRKR